MTRYVISDAHIGHNNIGNFRTGFGDISSEEHWEMALEGLRKLRKRDTLFLLGDICFYPEHLKLIKDIPCRNKVLFCGNHDPEQKLSMKDLVDTYEQVYSLRSYKGYWQTHAPVHPQELRGKSCMHGHTHNVLVTGDDGLPDRRYINVCVEYTGYDPITWEYATSEEYQQECEHKWLNEYGGKV